MSENTAPAPTAPGGGAATLADLVALDAIALDERAGGWEEAVRVAGRLLEETGVAGSAYTDAMVESVHRNGPYIVLAPGFAFPHARPMEAVHRTGMSWVRLATPVEFGAKANDPVTLVVALAATDSSTHQEAMASLACLLTGPTREALDSAATPEEVHALLRGEGADAPAPAGRVADDRPAGRGSGERTRNHVLTVCGNGLGTSLFLKNTLEQVFDHWGWTGLVSVEATDTVSARGKAEQADFILTSGEIARALGDVGVPVRVIQDFTSRAEIDAALRQIYDL